jgi:membrane protease YdiL (CAAX protease family)
MKTLVVLTVLPLCVIGVQLALDLEGVEGYSIYKLFLLVPPLIYCHVKGIGVWRDIFRPGNWQNHLPVAVGLGAAAVFIFWGAYWLLGDLLLDKAMIAGKISEQFSVTSTTVLMVAPVTIFLNSLLEEFFYRGFAFGQLVQKNRLLAYLLPASAYTAQHMLFIYHWAEPLPMTIAVVGLMVFALVLQKIYEAADSLVAPWVVHILGDVAMMGVAITMLRPFGA